jgi:endo-beta-N-acetylglucosaminidase D
MSDIIFVQQKHILDLDTRESVFYDLDEASPNKADKGKRQKGSIVLEKSSIEELMIV